MGEHAEICLDGRRRDVRGERAAARVRSFGPRTFGPKGHLDLLSAIGIASEGPRQDGKLGKGWSAQRARSLAQRPWAPALCLAAVAFCAACGDNKAARPAQDLGWRDGVALSEPTDLNPDPGVLEINLQATPANLNVIGSAVTPVWTYNGTTPGPLIHAKAGDHLIVHFTNALPEDTSVHWHGIRLPAAMDGVPGHTQAPVHPGGAFDYSFVLPDEGLFWYHPHADSAAQVGYGLYGPIVVEPSDADAHAPGEVNRAELGDEVVLVLSDMGIEADARWRRR